MFFTCCGKPGDGTPCLYEMDVVECCATCPFSEFRWPDEFEEDYYGHIPS